MSERTWEGRAITPGHFYDLRPEQCDGVRVVEGEQEACDKPAIGLRLPEDPSDPPWPACVHHARVGQMVTLADLLAAHDEWCTE